MRHYLSAILLFFALLPLVESGAQEVLGNPSSERFPVIQSSLDDGFYVLAEQQARGVLLSGPSEEERRDAALLMAHALWGQKRFSEMLQLLMSEGNGPGVAYWRARAYFELRRYDEALATIESGEEGLKGTLYAPAALRLKGRLQELSGKLNDAAASYKLFASLYPTGPGINDNMLDLADVYLAQERYADAKALYEVLLKDPEEPGARLAQLRLAHLLYTTGSDEDVDAAREMLMVLVDDDMVRLASRIDACIELSALEEHAGRDDEAVAALRKGIALSPDARLRVSLKLALAQKILSGGDVAAALKLLEECRTEAPDERVAAELQLEKAGALLKGERFADAVDAYQVYLDVSDDSEGLAEAYMGKGIALWGLARYAEAAVLFDKAAKAYSSNSEKAAAVIKAGDSYYQCGRFEEAEKRYRSFILDYSGNENMPNVLYQLGLVLARIGRRTEALATFDIVEASHANSPFAERAAMRSAHILRASGQWEAALKKYTQISQTYTNSADAVTAQHQRGLVLYQLGRYEEAQEVFNFEVENHPESEYAPQAYYMRGFCLYARGQIDEAIQTCQQFVKEYPTSAWTPEVVFWLAEHYYNQGDYDAAMPLFLQVAKEFSSHPLAPRALYWAGRAAAAESDYRGAIERYSEVAKSYPESDILPQIRFAQGDALTMIGEFSRAILAFEEVIKNYPESDLVNAAWGRKGDCQFSLGAENPVRYEEAMASYQAILDRPVAPAPLKLQAEYKIGRCLEKQGMFDKAFSRYMNVVYSFPATERSPRSVMWFTRASFGAAALKENEQSWVDAVQVYERVVEAAVPAADEARKKMEKIRTANWLLFEQARESE
ncbi:MAG: tetratricopeptide repeat protein [Pontiellaceae bacterium]|nr:tetratricopeptide repeat protein [Pontiellaceae bacterium]